MYRRSREIFASFLLLGAASWSRFVRQGGNFSTLCAMTQRVNIPPFRKDGDKLGSNRTKA